MFSKTMIVLSAAFLVAAPALAQDNEYEGRVRSPMQQSVVAPSAAFAEVTRPPVSRFTAVEKAWFDRVTRPGY